MICRDQPDLTRCLGGQWCASRPFVNCSDSRVSSNVDGQAMMFEELGSILFCRFDPEKIYPRGLFWHI